MHRVLAQQAKRLLATIKDKKHRAVLKCLTQGNPETMIADIRSMGLADSMRTLMFHFPLDENGTKSHYLDVLAQSFPKVVCKAMFQMNKASMKCPISRKSLKKVLQAQLATEPFASYFLEYYSSFKIKNSNQTHPSFDLCQLPESVINEYCARNQNDQKKFFNQFLVGFGNKIILFVFGYGDFYQYLYGSTEEQIASDLQIALKKKSELVRFVVREDDLIAYERISFADHSFTQSVDSQYTQRARTNHENTHGLSDPAPIDSSIATKKLSCSGESPFPPVTPPPAKEQDSSYFMLDLLTADKSQKGRRPFSPDQAPNVHLGNNPVLSWLEATSNLDAAKELFSASDCSLTQSGSTSQLAFSPAKPGPTTQLYFSPAKSTLRSHLYFSPENSDSETDHIAAESAHQKKIVLSFPGVNERHPEEEQSPDSALTFQALSC
ncbi:MAG: hypothetical protein ACRCXC_13250 [Legionella sp.]